MKKRIIGLILILLFIPNMVKAANASVSISAPSSVYVGDTVTVGVTISSGASLGNWDLTVNYDDGKLEYISTTADRPQRAFGEAGGSGQTSTYYSWTFKAKSSGEASFNISSLSIIDWDNLKEMDINGSTSTTINVVNPSKPSSGGSSNNGGSGNQTNNDYKYSDDNSLSSLNIEGFDINFDSSVTEYSISVPNDTKKVSVGATANDGKASVSGIGDYDVKEGSNKIEIAVTAENGDVRTYTIDVVVKEASPIEVKVSDKDLSVVRKSDKLPKVNATYKADTILIKGESVPCYHSEITGIYLVGLMDDKGKVSLYRYDSSSDKFYVYTEVNIGGVYLALTDSKDIPSGYTKGKITVEGKEYDAYLKDGMYPLLHGINLETGKEDFYCYDDVDKTLQRFAGVSSVAGGKKTFLIICGLAALCLFEFIMIIVSVISKNKKLKKFLHDKLDTKTEYEKSLDSNVDEVYHDESNITDDLTDEFMSSSDDNGVQDEVSTESESHIDSLSSVESESHINSLSSELKTSEDIEESLGHTALISNSVNNVYNNSHNRKEEIKRRKALRKNKKSKKNDDDEMFKF